MLKLEASRLDMLSRSGGERKGDSVLLAESPAVSDGGATEAIFLVRGASYAVRQYGTEAAADSLETGDRLTLVDDSTNAANSRALLLEASDGAAWVGYRSYSLNTPIKRSGGGFVDVLQNNGPAAVAD